MLFLCFLMIKNKKIILMYFQMNIFLKNIYITVSNIISSNKNIFKKHLDYNIMHNLLLLNKTIQ
jgi:hypothetical protein